jgi:hypothetical protein
MSLSLTVATDIANMALDHYVRSPVFKQTIQERPLPRILDGSKKPFGASKENVSWPVQGVFMNSVSGFFAGYTEDDALVFKQASNALRAQYAWKEAHAGLIITETELKKDGITISDSMKTSQHSQLELTRLTSILENRLEDFGESWARSINDMLWRDGTQDSKVSPGVLSILTDTPTTGTTGGLNRATYTWWRHRTSLGVTPNGTAQTLTKELRSELRQLRRYGGRPNIALAGSDFIEGLESEILEKGMYTQDGFRNEGKNDFGMADISLRGLGKFQYDPTLDDLSLSKYCYVFDTRHLILCPMEGEENKVRNPERPYNYFVFMKSMTWTGVLTTRQLNCHAVYSIA